MKRNHWISRMLSEAAVAVLVTIGAMAAPDPTVEEYLQKGDYEAAAAAIVKIAPAKLPRGGSAWEDLFRKRGQLRTFLDALLRVNPKDARARLERLNLENEPLGVQFIEELEVLLAPEAEWAFGGGKGGPRNETRFRDYFDLAYRLIRLYEKQNNLDKLGALALRIARGEEPFRDGWSYASEGSQDRNGERQYINACLALAIQNVAPSMLAELDRCLPDAPWLSARAQLNRRMGKGWPPEVRPALGWANLPEGVSAWVGNDAVLSAAGDDKYIYAGMPWGITVYSLAGEPLTRVALAAAANQIVVQGSFLWVATPESLFRIERDTWHIASLPVKPSALYLQDPILWIGTPTNVQRFDSAADEIEAYDMARGVEQFLFDGTHLWCQGDSLGTCARYDSPNDRWEPLAYEGKPVRLQEYANGILWGETMINEKIGYRPCIIDPNTLKVTPILIDDAEPYAKEYRGQGRVTGLNYEGVWDGKTVFSSYYYDAEKRVLRALPRNAQIERVHAARWKIATNNQIPGYHIFDNDIWESFRSDFALPDGTVLCACCPQCVQGYPYPQSEAAGDYDVNEREGGLYLVPPNGTLSRISSFVAADSLPGDVVTGVAFGREYHWICTHRGVAMCDAKKGVLAHFSGSTGLCANRVLSAVSLGDKTYFAIGYGDSGGGVAVYDGQTRVFTSMFQSDGLASDKLAGIERQGETLKLAYGVEFLRFQDGKYRLYPPGVFDPRTGTITGGGAPQDVPQPNWVKEDRKKMPILGGFIVSTQKYEDKTYFCGTRGLVILSGAAPAQQTPAVSTLAPQVKRSPEETLQAQSENLPITIQSPEDLERYLSDSNPFVRIKALEAIPRLNPPVPSDPSTRRWGPIMISEAYEPAVLQALRDPDERVRESALFWFFWMPDTSTGTQALKARLEDPDFAIRAIATFELTRRGERVDEKLLRCLLEQKDILYTLYPSRNFLASKEDLYRNLAPLADTAMFKLFLEFPPYIEDYDYRETVYPALGAALRQHPDAADVLLHAKDKGRFGAPGLDFAAQVFGAAGKEMLPVLRRAITSDDPLVRANAASGCGEIDDPEAVTCLAQALQFHDRQTGEALAAALVRSKRAEASPLLVKLFLQCRKDSESIQKKCEEIFARMEINNPQNGVLRKEIEEAHNKVLFPDDITRLLQKEKAREFYRLLAKEDDL